MTTGVNDEDRPLTSDPAALTRVEWTSLSDDLLLNLRMSDLGLSLESSPWLRERLDELARDLDARQLRFRPHFWLSDEWFTPDGTSGIAIPFYLAHPRLARLEESQMLEVEGGTPEWCLRILRHEAGHAIDNAYRLRRRRRRQQLFGSVVGRRIPSTTLRGLTARASCCTSSPGTRRAIPIEDFAETFAVWLTPESSGATRYAGWPALKKLEYMDRLMTEIGPRHPVADASPRRPAAATAQDAAQTLSAKARALRRGLSERLRSRSAPAVLRRTGVHKRNVTATRFFWRASARTSGSGWRVWTGEYQYTIDQVTG